MAGAGAPASAGDGGPKPFIAQVEHGFVIEPERTPGREPRPDRSKGTSRFPRREQDRHLIAQIVVGADDRPIRHRHDKRRRAENPLGQLRQPADHPALAVQVVHHEDAAGLELGLDVAKRLLGEQEALEPDARIARVQRQRIDQRIDDQVVSCAVLRRKLRPSSSGCDTLGSLYGLLG